MNFVTGIRSARLFRISRRRTPDQLAVSAANFSSVLKTCSTSAIDRFEFQSLIYLPFFEHKCFHAPLLPRGWLAMMKLIVRPFGKPNAEL